MEYVLGFVIILWIISSFIYRRSKFEPSLDSLIEELKYKKNLISGVRIEQPKSKPKHKHKPFVSYSDSTPELDPIKQLMFISAKDKLEYMQSEKWRTLKFSRLMIAQYKCESCGSFHNLNLHHITYERLTLEALEDVAILCEVCHTKLHSLLGYDRTTLYPISALKDCT